MNEQETFGRMDMGGPVYGTVEEVKTKNPQIFQKLTESGIPFSSDDIILRHEEKGYNEGHTASVYSLQKKGQSVWQDFYTSGEYM